MSVAGKTVGTIVIFAAALVIPVGLWYAQPRWATSTPAAISAVIDPVLRTPPSHSDEAEDRSKRLTKIIGDLGKGSHRDRLRARSELDCLLAEGPTKCTYFWILGCGIPEPRDDRSPRGYPPYFLQGLTEKFGANAYGVSLIQRCVQRELQSADRLLVLNALFLDQLEADRILREALEHGKLTANEAKNLRRDFFATDEVATAIERASAGEFWSFDAPHLLRPEFSTFQAAFPLTKPLDRVGNYDALVTAKDISQAYQDLLRSSRLPPAEAIVSTEHRMQAAKDLLPRIVQHGTPEWNSTKIRTRYLSDMHRIPNSFAIQNIEWPVSYTVDQGLRADCVATHRLLAVGLAAYAFRLEKRRSAVNLEELVRNRYMEEAPQDPWSHGRLQFDGRTRTVSSAGYEQPLRKGSFNLDGQKAGLSLSLP